MSTSEEMLKAATQAGDIDLLYRAIQEDPDILENKDIKSFGETPLHIAASAGHVEFAAEIMMLKPSFAWKLNQQGLSPIHLAMKEGQKEMVLCLVEINKELVRVKGREGLTLLHIASQIGEVDLLAAFLFACPESIEDVTVRSETALHLAVKYRQFEALQVLIGWLRRTRETKDADVKLEKTILNWKDATGNTILHLSALMNDLQMLVLLMEMEMDLEVKNKENLTALDVAVSAEMTSILSNAGAKSGSLVPDAPTLADQLKSKIMNKKETFIDKLLNLVADRIYSPLLRVRRNISGDERNAYLVVASLVATATYQSVLSPPGGVYQANAGDNISNSTSTSTIPLNSKATANATQVAIAGKSVMSHKDFFYFSLLNTSSFLASVMTVLALTPIGIVGPVLHYPMILFLISYIIILDEISSISENDISVMLLYSLLIAWGIYYILMKLILLLIKRK